MLLTFDRLLAILFFAYGELSFFEAFFESFFFGADFERYLARSAMNGSCCSFLQMAC